MKSASGGREQAMVNVRFREDLMGWATTVMAANQPVTVQVFYIQFPPNSVTP